MSNYSWKNWVKNQSIASYHGLPPYWTWRRDSFLNRTTHFLVDFLANSSHAEKRCLAYLISPDIVPFPMFNPAYNRQLWLMLRWSSFDSPTIVFTSFFLRATTTHSALHHSVFGNLSPQISGVNSDTDKIGRGSWRPRSLICRNFGYLFEVTGGPVRNWLCYTHTSLVQTLFNYVCSCAHLDFCITGLLCFPAVIRAQLRS